jgi:hypothetical protein
MSRNNFVNIILLVTWLTTVAAGVICNIQCCYTIACPAIAVLYEILNVCAYLSYIFYSFLHFCFSVLTTQWAPTGELAHKNE